MSESQDLPRQDPVQPDIWPDEHERRIEALRSLARPEESQPGASPIVTPSVTPPPAPARHSRAKILVAVVSALLLVGIVGGLIARQLSSARSPSGKHTPATITFSPASDNLTCPRDVAWSPDGAMVAVLGYQVSCASDNPTGYSYHPGSMKVYDAANGDQTAALQPDPIIAAALHLTPPVVATPDPNAAPSDRNTSKQVINYAHLLWSPDGKQLALTFSVLIATGVAADGGVATNVVQGILLSDLSGAQTRVLSHTLKHGETYSGLWNQTDGSYISSVGEQSRSGAANVRWGASAALIPPALRYQWTDTGHLQALTLLSATNVPVPLPSAPVGLPDGGEDFTVWQPGVALLITQDSSEPPQPLKTPVEIWQSSFAAWSANGKFLFAGGAGDEIGGWRLALTDLPAVDSASLSKIGLADAPVLPTRDAGLAAALHRYHDTSLNPDAQYTPVNLAWSPDGRRLAVEAPISHRGGAPAQVRDFAVSIYDCASGKLLGTLMPNTGPEVSFDQWMFLRWSPDSTHLLLYATALSGAQIWGPDALPR